MYESASSFGMFGMLQGVDTAHGEAKGCTRGASLGRCLYIS